jgi:hypothetical protein
MPSTVSANKGAFMNLTFHMVLLGVLAVIDVGLFLYRRWLENHDDHYIHLHNDAHDMNIINAQSTYAKRLDTIDKLKNWLLVAVIVYALSIAAMGIYTAWNSNG